MVRARSVNAWYANKKYMYAKRENACSKPKFNITFGSDCSPITYNTNDK